MSLKKLARKLKGGPGSGHHGHGGRKGKRGGSAPGKGGGSNAQILYWDDEMAYDLEGDPYDIAKDSGIYVSSDKDIRFVAVDNSDNIVAAAFVGSDSNEYTSDIVVSRNARKQGLGTKLLDETISDFRSEQDMFPDRVYRADAVNPTMARMMKKRGFEEIGRTMSGVELVLND